MIRIDVLPRLVKSARKLGLISEAEARLAELSEAFGNPHAHGGLGLRKIGRRSYELRLSLEWRIVLIDEGSRLVAFDVMNHGEVRRLISAPRSAR